MTSPTAQRKAGRQTLLLTLTLAAGLLWRSGWLPLSPFWFKYGGDGLWALAVYWGWGLVFRTLAPVRIALLSLGFAFAVEFSQLYHAPWIDAIRDTLPGRLVLGSTFNAPDLLAYAVGVALGLLVETAVARFPRS